jgi:hypothetical protein
MLSIKPRFALAMVIVSGFTLAVAGCAHQLAPQGHYQATPVVADGIPDDWSLPLRFSNASYTFQYNVTNDKKNIYVCVLSRDETTMLRMLRAGMTIYFDPKGDKSKDISLHYPLRKQPDPANFRNRNGEPLTNTGNPINNTGNPAANSGAPLTNTSNNIWKEELLGQSDYFGTTGFAGIENGQFGVNDSLNKSPIRVAMKLNRQDSMLVYEAIIPIRNILNNDLSGRSPKKAFSVGVVLNAFAVVPGNNDAPPRSYGGGRGLGLGVRGMGGGGGGGRRYASDRTPPVKEDVSWYQFRLVNQ